MNQLILLLALMSAGYIISNQILPLQSLKSYLSNYFNKRVISHKKWFKFVRTYISHLFNCSSCITFWLILIVMNDWQFALIGYVVAGYITKHLNNISI